MTFLESFEKVSTFLYNFFQFSGTAREKEEHYKSNFRISVRRYKFSAYLQKT